jgi:hypothetical protein
MGSLKLIQMPNQQNNEQKMGEKYLKTFMLDE